MKKHVFIMKVFAYIAILQGCSLYEDAKQTTALAKEFEMEGKAVSKRIETINKNAKEVDYRDGISDLEARALVEKHLLDTVPQWLGWEIKIQDNVDSWNATCTFAGTIKMLIVSKQNGTIYEEYDKNLERFLLKYNEPQH